MKQVKTQDLQCASIQVHNLHILHLNKKNYSGAQSENKLVGTQRAMESWKSVSDE